MTKLGRRCSCLLSALRPSARHHEGAGGLTRLPSEADLDGVLASLGATGLADAMAGVREAAATAANERAVLSGAVAEFCRRESRRASSA